MMAGLLSSSQLAAVQEVALRGMQTQVTIKRRVTVDSDYGDGESVTYQTVVATTKGWFYSRPTPVQDDDSGSLTTVNTYRLYLPVGTDVRVGDLVIVGQTAYVVSDTTAESTWLALLNVSLRKRE